MNQLRKDVETLAAPGTRQVGTHGHQLALEYLVDRMNEAGLIPYSGDKFEIPFQIESTSYINLAGVLPGKDRQLAPLMLVAHYDTCGDQPGADDNAAAIAIWFAVLHSLKQVKRQRDILFLFPDAEEPPRFLSEHMGSTNFYENQRTGDIQAGFVLDLMGHDVPMESMEDLIFTFGAESHPILAEILLKTEIPAGLRNIATLNRYVGDLSDHHVLREHGQPYLFFTCGRWSHYHQVSDRPEFLNYDKMGYIVRYLVALISNLELQEFGDKPPDYDPVEMELELFRRSVGPYLKQAEIPLNNRADIQDFVLNWINKYQL